MLALQGRGALHFKAVAAHLQGHGQLCHGLALRGWHLHPHASVLKVRQLLRLIELEHGGHAAVGTIEQLRPVGQGVSLHRMGHFAPHPVVQGLRFGDVVLGQVGAAQQRAKAVPKLVLKSAHGQVAAVLCGVQAVAGQRPGELVATGRGHAAPAVQASERDHRMGQHAVGNGHVHMPPLARALRVKQSGQDAHDSGHGAAQQVAHGQVGQGQLARRRAHLVGHPGIAAVIQVVPGLLAQRPGLAVAADAAVHQARVAGTHLVVAQAQASHYAGAKAFDQHIGGFAQLEQELHAFGVLQVQAHAAFIAVEHFAHRRRGVVARAQVFDLDDIGPQVGQVQGAHGAGQQAGEVEHAHALQRRAVGRMGGGAAHARAAVLRSSVFWTLPAAVSGSLSRNS